MGEKKEQTIIIRAGDYGHVLHFYLTDKETGQAYAIPDGATVTFICWIDGGTTAFISTTDNVSVVSQPEGHITYTTQSTDFTTNDAGEYWATIKVNNVTAIGVAKILVLGQYAEGA